MRSKSFVRLAACAALALCATASHAAVFFEDDFEGGNLTKTMSGFRWTDASSTAVVSDGPKRGAYSLRFRFAGKPMSTSADVEAGDAWAEQRFVLGGQYRDIWLKYDMWLPANYYHRVEPGANNNKGLVMYWNGAYSGLQNTSFHFWPAPGVPGSSQISVARKSNGQWVPDSHIFTNRADLDHRPATQGGDAGRWITWVMHVKVSDISANNGGAEVWKDGTKIVSLSGLENWHPTVNYLDTGYLLGWANSGFTQTTDIYLDNVVFGTSAADVGVGAKVPMPPVMQPVQ